MTISEKLWIKIYIAVISNPSSLDSHMYNAPKSKTKELIEITDCLYEEAVILVDSVE